MIELFIFYRSHTTAQNNSVLMMAATTSPPQRCDYVICPLSSSICRIRLDFDVSTYFMNYKQFINTYLQFS